MDIGGLRDKIEIETYTIGASDGAGGYAAGTYAVGSTVYANIMPLQGRRALEYGEVTDQQPYEIKLRYNTVITKNSRIKWLTNGNKYMTVHSVTYDPRTFETNIIAFANNED